MGHELKNAKRGMKGVPVAGAPRQNFNRIWPGELRALSSWRMIEIYIVRWREGSHSLLFGAPEGMFLSLDRIGSPSGAQVRVVPDEVLEGLYLDEESEGRIGLSCDLRDIWAASTKQVWPLEELGS